MTTETKLIVNAVKPNTSSAECVAYNTANADTIALGLIQAWQPDERTLAREAQAVKDAEAAACRKHEEAMALAVLAQVNPAGVALGFEATFKGGGNYSNGYHIGWKLNIGSGSGYGADAKKWMAIGEGTRLTVTPKQLERAKEKIAEVAAVDAAEAARRNVKQTVKERTHAFIAANPEFCKLVEQSAYNSGETFYYGSGRNRRASYNTAFMVNEDDTVKIGGETLFMDQWTQVYNLKAAQAAAMKTLKDSFQPAGGKAVAA